jgi:hypothetical protein
MTFVEMVESARSSEAKRTTYLRAILLILAFVLLPTVADLSGIRYRAGAHKLIDFEGFYLTGHLVWNGAVDQAYHFATMFKLQQSLSSSETFQPWTYPPPFDLVVAPLALMPLGVSYSVFMIGTFAAYVATVRRVAAENVVPVLMLLAPIIIVTIGCGQNGFLTATLIGLTCLGFQADRSLAGLPLGLMIIKPHLAVGFAVYALVNRRWATIFVAAATVAIASLLATVLLGPSVWSAFLDGAKEARVFLDRGFYPFFRMVSVYAVVRTLGFSAFVANTAQILVALTALGLVVLASRQFSTRQALGVTAIATLLISPYEYDYDLMSLGIALALLLPDLVNFGTTRERLAVYASCVFIGVFSLAQTIVSSLSDPDGTLGEGARLLSLNGVALIAILALTWRILLRSREKHFGSVEVSLERPIYVHSNPSRAATSM